MKASHPTGLGEPEVIGKQALFQPPARRLPITPTSDRPEESRDGKRFRMTIEVTRSTLEIIQQIQGKHRLSTGQVLPKWRIINDALQLYGKNKEGKHERSDQ